MTNQNYYEALLSLTERPEIWQTYTALELWNDEHISEKMLAFHLDSESEPASRPHSFIDRSVKWIAEYFGLVNGLQVVDFGCGPGLYTTRFQEYGAKVTGIDISSNSIEYARKRAKDDGLSIEYLQGNYLDIEISGSFDLLTLIYCDYCALSPEQRRKLLKRIKALLKPGGRVLLDVFSLQAFRGRNESSEIGRNFMGGFWSEGSDIGVRQTWKYDSEKVVLDRYDIFEKERERTVYNWLQYFDKETLERDLESNGFRVNECFANVAGDIYNEEFDTFAVVAESVE